MRYKQITHGQTFAERKNRIKNQLYIEKNGGLSKQWHYFDRKYNTKSQLLVYDETGNIITDSEKNMVSIYFTWNIG